MSTTLRQKLIACRADKIPSGWMTADVMARKEGFSTEESFNDTRKAALKAGLIECKNFRVAWGNCLRLRPHYRYVK